MHFLELKRRSEAVLARGWGGKRHLRHLQRRQHSGQSLQLSIVHAGACATSIVQASIFGVVTEEEGADVPPASLRVGPSNDHELLAIEALRLEPDPTVARSIGSIGELWDDAFETELAGLRPKLRTVASNVLAVAQTTDLLLEQAL
jgi:hypothetical protein